MADVSEIKAGGEIRQIKDAIARGVMIIDARFNSPNDLTGSNYVLFANGFCIQWGGNDLGSVTQQLSIEMANTNYYLGTGWGTIVPNVGSMYYTRNTTNFTIALNDRNATTKQGWVVVGQAKMD